MENRRQHYRLAMDAKQPMKALFQSPDAGESFTAEIVNLSIGGMCAAPETTASGTDGRWLAIFSLNTRKMQMMVERVYSVGELPGHCGYRFLPVVEPKQKEEQERAIWHFLLEKQRQERRQTREAGRLTG